MQPSSPTIDAGDPASDYSAEPAPSGGRINLGYTGGTPQAVASAAETAQVLSPGQFDKLTLGQTVSIAYQTSGSAAGATVNLDLVRDNTVVAPIASGVLDTGSYPWTIPGTVPLGDGYQVRVQVNDAAQPSGLSQGLFSIVGAGHDYYIAADGSDSNSGKDPADPMADLSALLRTYAVGAGDTIHVAAGDYSLLESIVLTSVNSGLSIVGPASGARLGPRQ